MDYKTCVYLQSDAITASFNIIKKSLCALHKNIHFTRSIKKQEAIIEEQILFLSIKESFVFFPHIFYCGNVRDGIAIEQ